jgi:hypothetical protein
VRCRTGSPRTASHMRQIPPESVTWVTLRSRHLESFEKDGSQPIARVAEHDGVRRQSERVSPLVAGRPATGRRGQTKVGSRRSRSLTIAEISAPAPHEFPELANSGLTLSAKLYELCSVSRSALIKWMNPHER